MRIQTIAATVYLAPTKGRRYLSKRSAVRAEARALLDRKYPAETGDESDGFHSWHWSNDEHLQRVYERLARFIGAAGRREVQS
ncbi:hypothetical protein [Stenotrophomonas maltophilia]|uniref:hypothetical protein n=1 Tax=Stenotrophomonas maltophilia TaxID=40324 RepID=UPI0039C009DE